LPSFFPCLIDKVSEKPKTEQVSIRRAPRIWAFAITGAVLGLIAALAAYFLFAQGGPENPLFLLIFAFASVGAGAGISIAVTLDWLFAKKVKRATAKRETK
jgi:hypothetical protein